MKPRGPIVITGFMGCGKTEVARWLALRLDLPMTDLDHEITERTGRTPAELILEKGEPEFREIETDTLREVLGRGIVRVIALGGGAWITKANRKTIGEHQGVTVWLDALFELCWQRIETSTQDRPLGRSRDEAEQLYRSRQPVYQLATIHVPVRADETLEDLVDRIEATLENYRAEAR